MLFRSRTQIIRSNTIGASYGDAFLAALAVGDVQPADIKIWNPIASEFVADEGTAALYQRRYKIFRGLYENTAELMRQLDD